MSEKNDKVGSLSRKEERRQEEIARFRQYTYSEMPKGPVWKLVVELFPEPSTCSSDILSIVEVVLSASYLHWPDVDTWRGLLPDWFLEATPVLTQEELSRLLAITPEGAWDTLPWEFESWIDAIYVREWLWWGHRRSGSRLEIYLLLMSWPASLEAFEHIVKAAGGTIIESRTA